MSKYKVTPDFMDDLDGWRDRFVNGESKVNVFTSETINNMVERWQFEHFSNDEIIKRLVALLNWINGEDVFEVGKPKYVVQRKDAVLGGVHQYLNLEQSGNVRLVYGLENATRFDDFEQASEWYNKHFEVVEVDEKEL